MNRSLVVPSLLVLAAACSSNPEPVATPTAPPPAAVQPVVATPTPTTTAAAFEPVGNYDFNVEFQGRQDSGVFTISRDAGGKLSGKLLGPNGEQLPLSRVTAEGKKLIMAAQIPEGPELVFTLEFSDADKFAGTVSVQGMDGRISGARKKG